jgi:hypothetical protein
MWEAYIMTFLWELERACTDWLWAKKAVVESKPGGRMKGILTDAMLNLGLEG